MPFHNLWSRRKNCIGIEYRCNFSNCWLTSRAAFLHQFVSDAVDSVVAFINFNWKTLRSNVGMACRNAFLLLIDDVNIFNVIVNSKCHFAIYGHIDKNCIGIEYRCNFSNCWLTSRAEFLHQFAVDVLDSVMAFINFNWKTFRINGM